MTKSDTWEGGLLDLVFLNTDFTGLGDAGGLRGSVTPGSIYVSLHTGDPGDTGNQTTSECTYTGYGRVAVARSGSGWTRSGDTTDNVAAIVFGACTAGSETATHFGIGTDSTGTGKLMYSGALTAGLAISSGITPQFAIGDCNVQEL